MIKNNLQQINPEDRENLKKIYNISHSTLNKKPHQNKTSILVGLDIINEKAEAQKQKLQNFEKSEESFLKNIFEAENKLKDNVLVKLKSIKEKNYLMMQEILKTEQYLKALAEKTTNQQINQLKNQNINQELKLTEEVIGNFSKDIDDINYYMKNTSKKQIELFNEQSQKNKQNIDHILSNKMNSKDKFKVLDKMADQLKFLETNIKNWETQVNDSVHTPLNQNY